MGVPVSGLPWGYRFACPGISSACTLRVDSPAEGRGELRDQPQCARTRQRTPPGTPQPVHPRCPEARVTHAFAAPAVFTATIGV